MAVETDYKKTLLDPGAVYDTPQTIVDDASLTRDQKIELLHRWRYDANELAVAEEEGMIGGEPNLLRQVVLALEALGAEIDDEHAPPTKQGSA
tara:strand:+ start:333 stop:611 length:279 start_codon:yes stop_codon:yes gene_type:complete